MITSRIREVASRIHVWWATRSIDRDGGSRDGENGEVPGGTALAVGMLVLAIAVISFFFAYWKNNSNIPNVPGTG